MKVKITIQADNAAFADNGYAEVKWILGELARKAELSSTLPLVKGDHLAVYDSNGNRVGELRVSR